jgi:transposase
MKEAERTARDKRIRGTFEQTRSIKATARQTGHSVGTVRSVLRGVPRKRARKERQRRTSKLDAFKVQLRGLVLDDKLTAVLAYEELQGMGFDGGYSIVKRYVQTLGPSPAKPPTTRVDHPPGKEGQVDWSPYTVWLGGERTIVHAFSFILPFSRWQFLRFATNEQLETLVSLHDQAFEELSAVPVCMTYDNMTTVGRHIEPGKIWINPRFASWASSYGFDIVLTTPGNPKEHGSVERPFHYVEHNCLRRKRFRFDDMEDLNRHARWWCANVANIRVHGTTRRRPIDLIQIERSFLRPLPRARPEAYQDVARKVGTDFCVLFQTNGYSVSPRFAGREVTARVFAKRIEFLIGDEAVTVHERCFERHQRLVLQEHEDEFCRTTPSRRVLESVFLRLGDRARTYYEGLRTQRGRGAGYHMKRILSLADRHGVSTVIAAMNHAAQYGSYSADAVARVINRGGVREPAPPTPTGEVPMPADRVRRWLEGLDVEGRDLEDFDALIDREGEHDDGQE